MSDPEDLEGAGSPKPIHAQQLNPDEYVAVRKVDFEKLSLAALESSDVKEEPDAYEVRQFFPKDAWGGSWSRQPEKKDLHPIAKTTGLTLSAPKILMTGTSSMSARAEVTRDSPFGKVTVFEEDQLAELRAALDNALQALQGLKPDNDNADISDNRQLITLSRQEYLALESRLVAGRELARSRYVDEFFLAFFHGLGTWAARILAAGVVALGAAAVGLLEHLDKLQLTIQALMAG